VTFSDTAVSIEKGHEVAMRGTRSGETGLWSVDLDTGTSSRSSTHTAQHTAHGGFPRPAPHGTHPFSPQTSGSCAHTRGGHSAATVPVVPRNRSVHRGTPLCFPSHASPLAAHWGSSYPHTSDHPSADPDSAFPLVPDDYSVHKGTAPCSPSHAPPLAAHWGSPCRHTSDHPSADPASAFLPQAHAVSPTTERDALPSFLPGPSPRGPSLPAQALNAAPLPTVAHKVALAHASLGCPPESTMAPALRKGFIHMDEVNEDQLARFPPHALATAKGRLARHRQGQRSTKADKAARRRGSGGAAGAEPPEDPDTEPSQPGRLYLDSTGRLPATSPRGADSILVIADAESGYIHLEPVMGRTAAAIARAFRRGHQWLTDHGVRASRLRLDNEVSGDLRRAVRDAGSSLSSALRETTGQTRQNDTSAQSRNTSRASWPSLIPPSPRTSGTFSSLKLS